MVLSGESKTETATQKKREDERKKGNIFLSNDIINVISLITVFYTIKMMFPYFYTTLKDFILRYINYGATTTDISDTFALNITLDVITVFAKTALPILLITILISFSITMAQTKLSFNMSSLKPKFSRMSPLQGIKKLFSLKSFVDIVKGLIKISIISSILYKFYISKLNDISKTLSMEFYQSCVFILSSVLELVLNVSMIFIFIAGLDYLYQWWEYERQIKMSKHEIKEEYKQMEGDPKVKGKIKEKQRAMAMSRMMQAVPDADVVVRNPTHFAVALRYNLDKDNAPIVVAKGRDELALRIVKVAEENNVYVLENVALARAIYATSELNREIPMDYYGAVAEVLAFVYKLKNKEIK